MLQPENKPDEYLDSLVSRYRYPYGTDTIPHEIGKNLYPVLKDWSVEVGFEKYFIETYFSGSYAKGTCIKIATDLDLFISFNHSILDEGKTLRGIYLSLFDYFKKNGYSSRVQNVSVGIDYYGTEHTKPPWGKRFQIDLVPGVKYSGNTEDHNLYSTKSGTWLKTNVNNHIKLIKNSGRLREIICAKIWKINHKIKISSFYLELLILEILSGRSKNNLADNFYTFIDELSKGFALRKKIVDPANGNNTISDELSNEEKIVIQGVALGSLQAFQNGFLSKIVY